MTTDALSAPVSVAQEPGLGARLGAALTAFGKAVSAASDAQARYDRVLRLQALSDDELARRGLAREDIVRHVFRDAFA